MVRFNKIQLVSMCAIGAFATPSLAQDEAAQCSFTLEGAHVWTGSEFVERDVAVEGRTFVEVAGEGAARMPASWLYLIPPLADMHTHNLDQPTPQNLSAHRDHLDNGIYYALNPNNIRLESGAPPLEPSHVEALYTGGGLTAPGGHPRPLYEGLASSGQLPGVSVEDLPGRAFHEVSTADEARSAIEAVQRQGSNLVKLYLMYHENPDSEGLSEDVFRAAVAHAHARGMRAIVHANSAADFRLAVDAGADAIMHMPGAYPREDDDAIYRLTAEDAARAAEAGVLVVPTIALGFNRYAGEELRRVQEIQRHNLTLLRDASVSIAAGADRYGATAIDELVQLRASGVFDGTQMLNIATRNGTAFLFPDREVGMLSPGAEASFLGYFADPRTSWYLLASPLFGMRSGQVIADAGILERLCEAEADGET